MMLVGNWRALAGQTENLVRWGAAGNMKVTHAIAMHGLQVLPGLALWFSATALSAPTRVRIIAVAIAGYLGLVIAATVQWLDGRALTQFGWIDGLLWLASTATLAGVALGALLTLRRSQPATR